MTKLSIALLATAMLIAPTAAVHGQQAAAKGEIVGNWKLLSFYDESIDTGKMTNVMCENPRGFLILTAEGRIAVIVVSSSREAPKKPPATDVEAAELWKTMLAYVGKYEIDPIPTEPGFGMTIQSEVASNPLLEGRDRKFFVRLDGNKLILKTTPPTRNPVTGEMTTRNVVSEREP
jgi:hypothetical protein